MIATIIIALLIFGYTAKVIVKMLRKDSCSDCHCACPVSEDKNKTTQEGHKV
ncbi:MULTISPECIES: FeoB-associated Cys-rich membrane protein [unclassified Enterococcus]|uniref:FeoB-associated Cys-rich membrane protein n=1 Tax=unclassified Enterococcus TaxID=2608891 RepID=UPI000AAA87D9|nr:MULTISPECIES: FeoB-associated Cys-rich membrane protein [unclassified Enterococcus]HCE12259.1 FeoB-associated Cys-rich membrane protein [Enterococcus sp.]